MEFSHCNFNFFDVQVSQLLVEEDGRVKGVSYIMSCISEMRVKDVIKLIKLDTFLV